MIIIIYFPFQEVSRMKDQNEHMEGEKKESGPETTLPLIEDSYLTESITLNGLRSISMNSISRRSVKEVENGNCDPLVSKDKAANEISDDDNEYTCRPSVNSHYVDLFTVGLAFLLVYSAHVGLTALQSSLHTEAGIGVINLCVTYTGAVLSGFYSTPVSQKLNVRTNLCLGFASILLFVIAHFYPRSYTLIPTSALVGLTAGPLWTTLSFYLTSIGVRYATKTKKPLRATVNKFNGIFFMMQKSMNIWGNLISSLVLHTVHSRSNGVALTKNITAKQTLFKNGFSYSAITSPSYSLLDKVSKNVSSLNSRSLQFGNTISTTASSADGFSTILCGKHDCPGSFSGKHVHAPKPEQTTIYILMSVYLVLVFLGIIITITRIKHVETDDNPKLKNKQLFLAAAKILKNYKMCLLIPLCFYTGFNQGLITSEYNKVSTCTQ